MMSKAGYSATPLIKKLGITESTRVFLINAPENYWELVELDTQKRTVGFDGLPDLVHLFVTSYKQFQLEMKKLHPLYTSKTSVIIWVSWYKKSSGLKTDLTEDVVRDYALANGLVDIKVCAISDVWSALKLVVPKYLR
jgi:hypothetical protein